jgi:hypothetical protein
MVLDTLSIPAMSTKCKRVFSSSKKLLSPQRCRIKEDLIEASECLKAWWDCGMIMQWAAAARPVRPAVRFSYTIVFYSLIAPRSIFDIPISSFPNWEERG